eukprot:EG_transcript_37501
MPPSVAAWRSYVERFSALTADLVKLIEAVVKASHAYYTLQQLHDRACQLEALLADSVKWVEAVAARLWPDPEHVFSGQASAPSALSSIALLHLPAPHEDPHRLLRSLPERFETIVERATDQLQWIAAACAAFTKDRLPDADSPTEAPVEAEPAEAPGAEEAA